ncbi:MAG: hypothetical protein JWO64_2425 [Hyphomicrobiales bacterium]|jgi:hypothetical protein|nr:hypothetical protein [Hyphomicrobiales bacterium]
MSPATMTPFIGNVRGKLFLAAAALIAVAAFVGLRDASAPPAPVVQASAMADSPGADTPHPDTHLASLQSAFAMSHVGALRDEADIVGKEPAPKARAAAAPRPQAAPRANAPVAQAPLPPAIPAPQAAEPAPPESKPSSLFGFVPALPSPGKWVERVASIGDSITSFVRGR